MKIKLIVILSWTLILYNRSGVGVLMVPGFSSYNNCVQGGKDFFKHSEYTFKNVACIEVK